MSDVGSLQIMRTSVGVPHTLEERIRDARRRAFVGREAELRIFRAALANRSGPPCLLYVHGRSGTGKSALLHRFADEAREQGRSVVHLDGTLIGGPPPVPGARAHVASDADVLFIDALEQSPAMMNWLTGRLLPTLGPGTVIVVAARQPPGTQWCARSWPDPIPVIELNDLGVREAAELLRRRHVPGPARAVLLAFAGGNPLALALGAAATRQAADPYSWEPGPELVTTLARRLTGPVPSAAHALSLAVSACALVTTEALLRSVAGDEAPGLYAWLRRHPAIEAAPGGLRPMRTARTVLDREFRWRNPQRHAEIRHALVQHLFHARRETDGDAAHTARGLSWLLYRDLPDTGDEDAGEYLVGTPHPRDRPLLDGLPAGSEVTADAQVRMFRHTGTGEVAAISVTRRRHTPDEAAGGDDPVTTSLWRSIADRMPEDGGHVLVTWLHLLPNGRWSPELAAAVRVAAFENWLEAGQAAWSFVVLPATIPLGRSLEEAGHDRLGDPIEYGTEVLCLYGHDWRHVPGPAWITAISNRVIDGRAVRDDRVAGSPAALTRPEFAAAVREALGSWTDPRAFRAGALITSHVVPAGLEGDDAEQFLRDQIMDAVDELRARACGDRMHRALATTYFYGTPTQKAAAARLGMAFSTYRRHLARGIEEVTQHLWRGGVS